MKREDFYIGWEEKAPESNRKTVKKYLTLLFVILPLIILTVVYFQNPFNDYTSEITSLNVYEGIYRENPFPILEIESDNIPEGYDKNALLVGYGKFGAKGIMHKVQEAAGDLNGKKIKIDGSIIYGDGKIIIQLTKNEDSFKGVLDQEKFSFNNPIDIESEELTGTIIDPKCWFGVMKPGYGKVHKSCAIACIRGGIPPVLKVVNGVGFDYYLLKNQKQEELVQALLPKVAEEIDLVGKTYRQNGWKVLVVNPNQFN